MTTTSVVTRLSLVGVLATVLSMAAPDSITPDTSLRPPGAKSMANVGPYGGRALMSPPAVAPTTPFATTGSPSVRRHDAPRRDGDRRPRKRPRLRLQQTGSADRWVERPGLETGDVSTLVLYDTTNTFGWLGELYAMMVGNLVSHFGSWTAVPVVQYTAGLLEGYTAVIYIGSTYNEPIPRAFLDDVSATGKPIIWMYDNIWFLRDHVTPAFSFIDRYGWKPGFFDTTTVDEVRYKGRSLRRYGANLAGILQPDPFGPFDPLRAQILAEAVRSSDGSSLPWAIRSDNLTYIGEIPLAYIGEGDRWLIFADLLFDALAPFQPERHRALVRLEDLNPDSDPDLVRAAADYLASQDVPFGFGVSPVYTDPLGTYNNGRRETVQLKNRPELVDALRYLQERGGVMIEHGYTHQYLRTRNPYNAVTGDDFEFYRVTENENHTLNYLGPVPGDSARFMRRRIRRARTAFTKAGLAEPTFFEFPHYAGSAVDYAVVHDHFGARWERAFYFSGLLTGGAIDYSRLAGQMFPFVVRDVYGTKVLPENLGSVEPEPFFIFPTRFPEQIVADADRTLVVRDGIASFYFHPAYVDLHYLEEVIGGLKGLGYTFVDPHGL